ncbi:MAG: YbfB/YjiJ family MFS transporter [Anaerolineae bacterium]|nr:YbfB/YjiJ family MFS transporter [Gemmatimonadaceae bacterium]
MISKSQSPVWLAVGGLIALAAALGVGRFVYTPILPLMVEDLGMTTTMAGALASANFAGYLIGALVAASSAVLGSRRRWLIAALSVSAASTGAMGLVESTAAFFVLRFLGGFASAFVLVFSSAIVLDRPSAAERSKLAVVHFAGVGSGIAASAILVSILVAAGGEWRSLWLASGLLSLVCLGIVYTLIPNRTERHTPSTTGAAPRSSALRNLVVAYGLFGFGYVITATFLVTIVRASEVVRSAEPIVWLLVGLAAAPSIAFWAFLAKKMGNARALALAFAIEAAGVAASVLWYTLPGIVACASLLGGTFMGITALGLIEARRLSHGEPRRTLAIMTASFGLGQILGPAFAGFVHDLTGSFLVPSLAAVGALIVAATLVVTPPRVAV